MKGVQWPNPLVYRVPEVFHAIESSTNKGHFGDGEGCRRRQRAPIRYRGSNKPDTSGYRGIQWFLRILNGGYVDIEVAILI